MIALLSILLLICSIKLLFDFLFASLVLERTEITHFVAFIMFSVIRTVCYNSFLVFFFLFVVIEGYSQHSSLKTSPEPESHFNAIEDSFHEKRE